MKYLSLIVLLTLFYAGCSKQPQEQLDSRYIEAFQRLNRFQIAVTDSVFADAVGPQDSASWRLYGQGLKDEEQMQYYDALNAYSGIVQRDAGFAPAYLAMARIYDRIGFPWLALEAADAYAEKSGSEAYGKYELARYALAYGDYRRARKAATESARAGFDPAATAVLGAEANFMLNDVESAERAYNGAVSAGPLTGNFYRAAADYFEARGMLDSSITLGRMAITAFAGDMGPIQEHFYRCLRTGYLFDARRVRDSISERDTSQVLKASMALSYDWAANDLQQSLMDLYRYGQIATHAISPLFYDLETRRRVQDAMGTQESLDNLQILIDKQSLPPDFEYFLKYRKLYAYVDMYMGSSAQTQLDSLQGEFGKGDVRDLFELLLAAGGGNDTLYTRLSKRLLEDHESDAAFLTRMGDVLNHPVVHRPAEPAGLYTRALEADPGYRRAFEHLVAFYMDRGDYGRALDAYRTYGQFSEQSPEMSLRRAVCLAQGREIDEACRTFSQNVPVVSGEVALIGSFFTALSRSYTSDRILQLSFDLAETNPDDPDIQALAASWQAEYGRFKESAALAGRALAVEPEQAPAAAVLAWADFNLAEESQAFKRFDSMYAKYPYNPEVNLYYSKALMAAKKDLLFARNYAVVATGSRSLGLRALANLWTYYMMDGRPDLAVGVGRQSVSTFPDYPRAHFLLGKALFLYERVGDARSELKKAVELGLGGDDLAEARKLLEG